MLFFYRISTMKLNAYTFRKKVDTYINLHYRVEIYLYVYSCDLLCVCAGLMSTSVSRSNSSSSSSSVLFFLLPLTPRAAVVVRQRKVRSVTMVEVVDCVVTKRGRGRVLRGLLDLLEDPSSSRPRARPRQSSSTVSLMVKRNTSGEVEGGEASEI